MLSKAPIDELSRQAAERLDGLRCTDTEWGARGARGNELNTQSTPRDGQPSQTCVVLRLFSEENCLMRESSFLDSSERKGVKGMSCERVVMNPHVFTFTRLLFSTSMLDTEKLIKAL